MPKGGKREITEVYGMKESVCSKADAKSPEIWLEKDLQERFVIEYGRFLMA